MEILQRIFSALGMRRMGCYTWPFEVCVCVTEKNKKKATWFVISTALLNKLVKSCGDNAAILFVACVTSEKEKEDNRKDTAVAVRKMMLDP
jgi:hypothetical protein